MKLKNTILAGLLVIATLPAQAQNIVGAGATFPNPLYQKWSMMAKPSGIEINYQSVGSGAGQTQIKNRTVDFGASDAPMKPEDLEKHKLVQFPTVMGSLVPIVHIPGITNNQLKLTGTLLSDIYLGKITRWNDPQIQAVNPTLNLPNLVISVIYRADGSGTTWIWTKYLSKTSQEWDGRVGFATSVKWPAGSGSKGNEGVSASVKQLVGSIGYVESAYAKLGKLVITQLRNQQGNFVAATQENFIAAAQHADWNVAGMAADLIDQPGENSWPIVSPTFVLVPKDPKNPATLQTVLRFFDWTMTHGDAAAQELDYVPLPLQVKNLVRDTWKTQGLAN